MEKYLNTEDKTYYLFKKIFFHILFFIMALSFISCGSNTTSIKGGATKGPLANAIVSVYTFDSSKEGFKGTLLDTGSTDSSAAIVGINLPKPLNPPYIMEFTSIIGQTTDITTGIYPIMPTLTTVLTQELIDSGEKIYATPLTSLAVNSAINNSNSTTTKTEFLALLKIAADRVVETVGFGMDKDIDIFATPPLVNDTTTTTEKLSKVLAYRTAIEALMSVSSQMQKDSSSKGNIQEIINELARDLSDGKIDGKVKGVDSLFYNSKTLTKFTQDPKELIIPNTKHKVSNVKDILVNETTITRSRSSTTKLRDGTIKVTITAAKTETYASWDSFKWNDGSLWK